MSASAPQTRSRIVTRELTGALLLHALIIVIAFANVVFGGKSLVATDQHNPLDSRLDSSNYARGFVPAEEWQVRGLISHGPNLRDPETSWWQMEPATEFLRRAIATAEPPWWDPYSGFGTAAMANLTGAFFFPPTLLLALLGNWSALRTAYYLLLFLIAGASTYVLMREHGVGPRGAFFSAVAFSLGGGLVQTIPAAYGQSAAFIPLLLLLTKRLLERPAPRRIAGTALAFALVALSSFPPILIGAFGLTALYAITHAVSHRTLRPLLAFCAAGAIALALDAFYYLPAFSLMSSTRHVREFYRSAGIESLEWSNIFQILGPTLFGGARTFADPPIPNPTHVGFLFYSGVSALILGLLGTFPARGTRVLGWFSLLALLVVLMKVFGLPPVQWIGHLPGFRNIHFAVYLGIPLTFMLAVLGGLGIQALEQRWLRVTRVAGVAVIIAALYVVLFRAAGLAGVASHAQGWRWMADFQVSAAFAFLTIAAVLLAVSRGSRRHAAGITLTVAILVAELVVHATFPRQVRNDVWKRSEPYVEFLRRNAGIDRVFAVGALPANTGSAFDIVQTDSLYTMNATRAFHFYQRHFARSAYLFLREASRFPADPVLDAAGVRYIVLSNYAQRFQTEARRREYEEVFRDDAVAIFRRKGGDRYRVATNFRVRSADVSLEEVGRPPEPVILESTPSFPTFDAPSVPVTPRAVTFGRNAYSIRLRSERPGLLYCAEAHLPGWSARVNGRPVPIVPANYAFRAVEIPAGNVLVEFRYRPPGLIAGSLVSVAGLGILLTLFLSPRPGVQPGASHPQPAGAIDV